jgi:hypothetical protein
MTQGLVKSITSFENSSATYTHFLLGFPSICLQQYCNGFIFTVRSVIILQAQTSNDSCQIHDLPQNVPKLSLFYFHAV